MSLLGECRDINGLAVKHGLMYMAGPGECHQCVCESGIPKNCQDVMCHQPQNCSTFRKGARCCDFVCLDDITPGKADIVSLEGDFGLRLIASIITAVFSFSLLFFLVHRLRQRKIRSGRQNRQLSEDERSLGSIGYITGSLGYLPGAMERYEEPTAHFPHYPLWKPPGNYFPRGEAPPPYEEAVAATRAEALAAAMAGGNLRTTANFGRDALLGVNYNTYTAGTLLGSTAHRTIPINLATSASFTLQSEPFDENPCHGGSTCVSVATGTVSVTATVTAPPVSRPDLLLTESTHVPQDPSSRSNSNTIRRGDVSHRSEPRSDVGHRPESNACSDAFQWSEVPNRLDPGHRSDLCQRPDRGHRTDISLRLSSNVAADMQRTESNHLSEAHGNDGNAHLEVLERTENTHTHLQSDPNDRSNLRSDSLHRHDFSHQDISYRETPWRQDAESSINYRRADEWKLPSVPLPENSHSLPPQHSHGMHHSVNSVGQPQHQTATVHSHSYGRQHQTHVPHMDLPSCMLAQDSDAKDVKVGTSKVVIPLLSHVPKSGTGVYEDSFHSVPMDSSHTATLRRGKHPTMISNGMVTLRRNPVPVATPTLSSAKVMQLVSTNAVPSSLCLPSSAITSVDQPQCNGAPSIVSSPPATVASIVSTSPPKCTCPKVASPRCTCPGSCHSSVLSLAVNDSTLPQNSNLSLTQAGLDDNDDYRSECENCKSTHSSNYYLDAEDPEPEITMTLHRKPTDTGEENGNGYYRTSLTLPTRHRIVPLHGVGARDNWFSSMPETSSEDESDEE